ncbi:methyltransferase [Kribbella sp. NPDC051770]|uniref:methyltransferase n=1 Tax=Kribbella sp. NPDC051770 TaxID=3155413 RepID=UPI003425C024
MNPAETERALQELHRITDLTTPYAVRAAVSLGLAEQVAGGPRPVEALAEAVGAQPAGLRKLVRVLDGFFTLHNDEVGLGERGWVLLEDAVRARLDHANGYARVDDAWPGLLQAIRSGGSGYEAARGKAFYDDLGEDERLVASFDGQLAEWSGHWTTKLVELLGLTTEHVVDVGGGTGALLAAILEARPETSATLVELPSTAARAASLLTERGVRDRVTLAAQSFFEELPAGGDLYLIVQVLHNWADAETVAVLKRLAAAAGDRPIVVVERVNGVADNAADVASDLLMYAVFGAGERTEAEYAALAAEAGLEIAGIRQVLGALSAVELRPSR